MRDETKLKNDKINLQHDIEGLNATKRGLEDKLNTYLMSLSDREKQLNTVQGDVNRTQTDLQKTKENESRLS